MYVPIDPPLVSAEDSEQTRMALASGGALWSSLINESTAPHSIRTPMCTLHVLFTGFLNSHSVIEALATDLTRTGLNREKEAKH